MRIELNRVENATMSSPAKQGATHSPERWEFSWWTVMIAYTMIEPRSDRVTVCSPQTQHQCYQVIRTTRVHQSSRSSRMVTVQERVVRSRLQLGYSTPTSFINRYIFIHFYPITITSTTYSNLPMTDDRYQFTWCILNTPESQIYFVLFCRIFSVYIINRNCVNLIRQFIFSQITMFRNA